KQTIILLSLLVALTCFVLLKKSKTKYVCEEAVEDPPLIFISGQQSSGTGLMRIVLDAHPWINCGAEPIYPIRVLNMRKQLEMTNRDWGIQANLYPVAIDRATKAYIRELAVNMVDPTQIYCLKQPLMFEYLDVLAKLFPTAKFVHIVRDGRATVVSSITRRIVKPMHPVQALRIWDDAVRRELQFCQNVGRQRCYTIFYEKLVISAEKELRKLLAFLEVPWDPIVLRHETILDKLSHLNPHEASTKQFLKPIHTASLGAWAYPNSSFTPEQLNTSTKDAPLLKELGYDLAGTGLVRVLLDSHPMINCGAEPIYSMHVLALREDIKESSKDWLIKANIYPKAIDQATKAFIRELAVNMVDKAPIYCQKQPLLFRHLNYLAALFPEAKFVHVLRDGRAAIASTIERKIYPGLTHENPHTALQIWDKTVRQMLVDCQDLGPQRCYTIVYEKLVLYPEQELQKLLGKCHTKRFLEVPWDPIVLKHETILNNLSYLNPYEASTKQFSRKINTDSLSKWASSESILPDWFKAQAVDYSSLLHELEYDKVGVPPDYSKLPEVLPHI
ncbi:hypothetical protein X801_03600, partial [Opisthorchis viverrini]